MRYQNIEMTHAFEKKQALRKFFYSGNGWDCIIIFGAQDREDVHDLVDIANMQKLPIILFDIRKSQLDAFPDSPNVCKLEWDISKQDNIREILQVCKLFKVSHPFIYDNTCGGKSRLSHIETVLSMYMTMVFYAHTGHGGKNIVSSTFDVKKEERLDNKNYLMLLEKGSGIPHEIVTTRASQIGRKPCPKCQAKSRDVSIKGNILHCCKCKHEWSLDETYINPSLAYNSRNNGVKPSCPKCPANSSFITIRKKMTPEFKCGKCGHEFERN